MPVGVETYQDDVTVCAGTCSDYRITLVRTTEGDPLTACVTTQDRNGTPTTRCATVPGVPPTQPYVDTAIDRVEWAQETVAYERGVVADFYGDYVLGALCDPYDDVNVSCGKIFYTIENLIRGS